MDTITCPRCGRKNPATATNCTNCRINLQYALEHLDELDFARERPDSAVPVKQGASQDTPLSP